MILQSEHLPVVDQPLAEALSVAQAQLSSFKQHLIELQAALDAADQRERRLVHEVQNGVRNMLAVVRSIYRRSRESGASPSEFAEHFEGRLNAVARYHSAITGVGTAKTYLEDMVRDELLDVQSLDEPSLVIDGPPVLLTRKSAELMGLAIHELTTNSIKFGALCHQGRLTIKWSVVAGELDDILRFNWKEEAVTPLTAAPRPNGFGRQLIEEAMPYELGATTSFALKPGGIACSIDLPLGDQARAVPPEDEAWPLAPVSEENQ